MLRNSLRFRLILTSGIGILVALAAAGGLLVALFYFHTERLFDRHLYDHLEELAAAAETDADGMLRLTWIPSDPRFAQPLSGWYWQIASGGKTLLRSKSLLNEALSAADPGPGNRARYIELNDPTGVELRAIVQDVTLPGTETIFTFLVAGPHRDIDHDVMQFVSQLILMLGILALVLIAVFAVQIGIGLKPLRAVQAALTNIRSGRASRLPESFPNEILPVVQDFNALIDHKEKTIERARAHAGDLAHALKNPLTVIRNEAQSIAGPGGDVLRDHVAAVGAVIDRHLARSRAAGALGLPGSTADLRSITGDIVSSLRRLYPDRRIDADLEASGPLIFAGDAGDLEEMLGNLLDNACKWSRGRIALAAATAGDRLTITIEDDGPGVPADQLEDAIMRGRRLDTSRPGWGLGLAIVQELAGLYGGRLSFGPSRLGGLSVVLDLPSAGGSNRQDAELSPALGADAGA